jgi:hypothetical protein
MKKPAFRWLEAVGIPAFVCAVLFFGTGCGALKAAANPKVAWAMNDPAPMSVVVRRADVAEKTAQNVDRLMTETPVNDDSPWLAKVAPDKEAATKDMTELQAHDLYNPPGAKIVAAEVWAKELASLEKKDAKAAAAQPAPQAPSKDGKDTKDSSPASKEATAKDDKAEPVAAADPEPTPEPKGKGKGKGKGKAKAKAPKVADATPVKKKGGKGGKKAKGGAPEADTTSTTTASNDAKPTEKAADAKSVKSGDPVSTTTTTNANVPANGAAPATNAKYTSILAAIGADLGAEWAKVMEKKKAMGDVKGQIAVLESANDAKGISDADKKANKDKIAQLEKQLSGLEKEAKQLQTDFIPKAKAAAAKAPADVRDHFGPTLVNLRQAIDDANVSNSAAMIRYPMAASTLVDSAQTMAKIYVADVIEEQTGKRPSTQGLQPGVTMEGGDVKVTLNGLSSSDMGKISMGDLTAEVAKRTTAWTKRALGLVGTISATKEILDFEDDVLKNLLEGFTSAGWKAPAPTTIPEPAPAAAGGQPRA